MHTHKPGYHSAMYIFNQGWLQEFAKLLAVQQQKNLQYFDTSWVTGRHSKKSRTSNSQTLFFREPYRDLDRSLEK